MGNVRLTCKNCGKPFAVDWDKMVRIKTEILIRNMKNSNKQIPHDIPLDLPCPHCSITATYNRTDGEELDG